MTMPHRNLQAVISIGEYIPLRRSPGPHTALPWKMNDDSPILATGHLELSVAGSIRRLRSGDLHPLAGLPRLRDAQSDRCPPI